MTTKSQRTIEQIQREIKMSKQESIEEIKNFLIHIQPRVGEGAFAHVWECVEYLERASVVQPALSGEAATTKEAASYIEAAEDLRAWLHEHIDDVPDEIYIPFIASIERAATLRQQFAASKKRIGKLEKTLKKLAKKHTELKWNAKGLAKALSEQRRRELHAQRRAIA